VERFGLLSLVWTLTGYAGLFDLGLGRALTRLVAEGDSRGLDRELARPVWTALVLLGALGVAGAAIFALGAGKLAAALNAPQALRGEAVRAFLMAAAMVPLATLTAGLRGILEARRRFAGLSALRAAAGALTFAAPAAAARWSHDLAAPVAALAAVRAASLAAHVWMCARYRGGLFASRRFDPASAGPLFRFGGWLTVSSLLSPLMVYLDRFLIAGLVSAAAVALYVTPFEIVARLLVIPAAVSGVLFPEFSASAGPGAPKGLYWRGTCWIVAAVGPAAAVLALFATPGLRWWLGAEFARESASVLRILSAGLVVNAAAAVPSAWLQASGRPDLTARLHLAELPLYLAGVIWLIRQFGIEGAAFAWLARVSLDAALLAYFANRGAAPEAAARWSWQHAGTDCNRRAPL
jgi:O-antigen/teichoic acid export membrane protein